MAAIADAAGMSRPALYQYFADKSEIFQSAFVALFDDLVDNALVALQHSGSVAEQLDGFLQRYDGDLWQTMIESPHADEILRAKNADVAAAVGGVVARLTRGLAAFLDQHPGSASAREEWAVLLRFAPKGLTYDRPSVEAYRRRLTGLARVIAAGMDAERSAS